MLWFVQSIKNQSAKIGGGMSGLKAPSSLRKETSEKQSTSATPAKPTPSKALPKSSQMPLGPKSAEKDEVDEIYKNEDPIGTSVDMRKKVGSLTSTIANKKA